MKSIAPIRRGLQRKALILIVIIIFYLGSAVRGPFRVYIDAPGETGYFVAKLLIRGPVSIGSGHESEQPRFKIYEKILVVKANETFQFPMGFMWMGLPAHEARLYLRQPGYYFRDKPFYTLSLEGNYRKDTVNRIKPKTWQTYMEERKDKMGEQIDPRAAFWSEFRVIKRAYIPKLEDKLGPDEVWQQLDRLIEICRLTHDKHEEDIRRVCNENYINKALKWND
ncbi:MAG: hypothetical protein KUG82_10370 [Pseudomonadales bacterium]|nr:hypothetical protein [Pseudomonadales bacterium]